MGSWRRSEGDQNSNYEHTRSIFPPKVLFVLSLVDDIKDVYPRENDFKLCDQTKQTYVRNGMLFSEIGTDRTGRVDPRIIGTYPNGESYSMIQIRGPCSQYCSKLYTDTLKEHGIKISMTENGDPYENAVAERVNGILKDEFYLGDLPGDINHNRRQTRESIEIYNQLRPHLSCGMLTPVQMHAQSQIPIITWQDKASRNQVIS